MGIRLLATSTTDRVRTVSLFDSAIKNDLSVEGDPPQYTDVDIKRFVEDRSQTHLLKIAPVDELEPYNNPSYFEIRPLDDYEVTFALRASGNQSEALGAYDDPNLMLPLLWWMFRLGCTNWENVWKSEGGENVPLEFASNKMANRQSVSEDRMKFIPSEVITDIGGVVLQLSMITDQEKKVSGSSQPTPKTSDPSEKSAEKTDRAESTEISA